MKTEIPPENRRRRLLDMSLSETMRLADLLRKMLSFSKPDQLQKKPVELNQVLEEILLLHEKQLQERSILIQTDLQKHLPQVYASTDQLRQVFLNIIANARDAMPQGGTLTVSTTCASDTVLIRLSDTGVGIDGKNLKKIFDTFYTTKESVQGVGLGLSVCYGFIVDHGGDISVESKPGQGTTFTVSLPAYEPLSSTGDSET
jgi:two-component system NtrC family sensor kinase